MHRDAVRTKSSLSGEGRQCTSAGAAHPSMWIYTQNQEILFRNIQEIKERLNINIEFARPEDFVPPLKGTADRHVFIDTVGTITFYHYDPYAQLFSKVVRGFQRDLDDARKFMDSGMVNPQKFRALVAAIPDSAYARYPNLSRIGINNALETFLTEIS